MKVDKYSAEQLMGFYETMFKTRRFEEETFEFYKKGMMAGLAHLYMGEEAVAAGVCAALNDEDYIGSTHRGHGHLVARGAEIDRMMAEILGKETGYSNGKGGSMHIMAMDKGILGANGIVGGEIPIATGAAYTAKYKGTDQVAVSFMGDSATNEGTFHESINMAAAWDLPCVYVIENNLYGISVDIRDVTNTPDLAVRAKAYDIPGVVVDGMDVIAVYEAAVKAVKRAREGKGHYHRVQDLQMAGTPCRRPGYIQEEKKRDREGRLDEEMPCYELQSSYDRVRKSQGSRYRSSGRKSRSRDTGSSKIRSRQPLS